MTSTKIIIIVLAILSIASACEKENIATPSEDLDTILGIEPVPSSLGNKYTKKFNRYTKVVAPNGGAIHIVAQSNITNEQMIRCRSILEHFLTDYEGSLYGKDKGEIANKMADNKAVLLLLNGRDGTNSVFVNGQPLYEEEIQVEGHKWYVNQEYEGHRDAAYEEILHLVHDYGIGVDGRNSNPGAAPELQSAIRSAQENALSNNLWGIGASDWIKELKRENSLSQEYLAALIDSYYGLWGAFEGTNGMWGLYVAKTRDEIRIEDPQGQALLDDKFFHPYLTYNARIDKDFTGVFYLKFNEEVPYSHHSKYLKDITLLGTNPVNVIVNELDNDITGNDGANKVIFSGNKNEYQITDNDGQVMVVDNIPNRDGTNALRNIEQLQFVDEVIDL